MRQRNPEVDKLFPNGSREYLSRLLQEYGLTLVPHVKRDEAGATLHIRAKRGTEVRHIGTAHKFLSLNSKQQRARIEEVKRAFEEKNGY